jgi:hypothetical protein
MIIPALHCTFDVGCLRAFVTAAHDQQDGSSRPGVINSVTRTDINPQLPNSIATKLVIAVVASGEPINPALDGNPRSHVLEIIEPRLVKIAARCRQVMADFHPEDIRL